MSKVHSLLVVGVKMYIQNGVRLDIFSSLLTGAVALAAVLVSEDPGMS